MRVWPTVLNTLFRAFLCVPLGLVVGLLCITVVGMPLGLALGAIVGAFVSKPLRRHPLFNTKGDAE